MAGYRYTPKFRITPLNGAVRTIDLANDLTYLKRPVSIDPSYYVEVEKREDVNRARRPRRDGIRVEVAMRFAVGGNMADHALVAEIVSALLHREKTVELTLDNSTWRRVAIRRYRGPRPFGGKTAAGAMFELELECCELIDELPAIGSGSW